MSLRKTPTEYPTSVRVNGQPQSILSDSDLLFIIRQHCGDDVASVVESRLEMVGAPVNTSDLLDRLESIKSDLDSVSSALEFLCDDLDS